jgi:hypothetical protein
MMPGRPYRLVIAIHTSLPSRKDQLWFIAPILEVSSTAISTT